VDLTDAAITVDIGLGPNGQGGFGLEAAIEAELPSVDEDTARRLLDLAHHVCPYSNAIRGNVEVTLTVA
jgi:organic hydroperoxide reductase OsmC/OhrA